MKSLVKNIIIIIEFILILLLAASVCFLWKKEPEAVQTDAPAAEIKENTVDSESVKERVEKNYYDVSGKKVLMEDSTFGEIWIPALKNVPAFSKDKDLLKTRNGRKFYVENSEITSLLGVDVSVHQDNIDWAKVKQAGIDFAMVRLGFRGYGTEIGRAHV